MKVAVLSPITWRTPPRQYGPWEQVASNIAEGLIDAGVDVTLFATGDSETKGKLESVCPRPCGEDTQMDPKVFECLHIGHLMEQADKFDLIHNNFDFLPLTYSRLIKTPMVTTIHGFSSPRILPVYKEYNRTSFYVSISHADRSPELDYAATVYNGVNPDEFTFNPDPQDYFLFFGRIHPEKGTYESIQIAKQAGKKLIISGLIQDKDYFEQKIKPFINNEDIVYAGNSGPAERDKLLGGAAALLHPVAFDEPFGLSVAEAMFCGTPVIAYDRGAMPELVLQDKTGFLVKNPDEAVAAAKNLRAIDRKACRDWVSSKFSRRQMIDGYLNVYKTILDKKQ